MTKVSTFGIIGKHLLNLPATTSQPTSPNPTFNFLFCIDLTQFRWLVLICLKPVISHSKRYVQCNKIPIVTPLKLSRYQIPTFCDKSTSFPSNIYLFVTFYIFNAFVLRFKWKELEPTFWQNSYCCPNKMCVLDVDRPRILPSSQLNMCMWKVMLWK